MKRFLIVFTLIAGCCLAKGMIIQHGFDYEKPPSIYTDNDNQNCDWHYHNRWDAWWDDGKTWPEGWRDISRTTHYDHSWGDATGGLGEGSGSSLNKENDTGTVITGGAYNYLCKQQMEWSGIEATANLTGDCAPNPNVPQPTGPPEVGSEYCDVNDPTSATIPLVYFFNGSYGDWEQAEEDTTYTRNAQTKYKLRTGGMGVPGAMSLHVLSGWVKDLQMLGSGYKRILPPYPMILNHEWTSIGLLPYIYSGVTLGTVGQLGSDGYLYKALPDGQEYDVTPQYAGSRFYIFGVGDGEWHPYITANGVNLDHDTPEFCVGQQITFQLNGLGGYVNYISHWHLPGEFVNEPYSYSFTCNSYKRDDALLENNMNTSCWYNNKPGGTVSIGVNMNFSNGQNVSIAAKGNITIFRPTKIGENMCEDLAPNTITITDPCLYVTNNGGTLSLGNAQGGYPRFVAGYQAKPGDTFQETQIVQSYRKWGNNPPWDSGSGWWFDGYATKPGSISPASSNGIGLVQQTDKYPGIPLEQPEAKVNDIYRTYFQYQPASGGIWITLGCVYWSWADDATYDGSSWNIPPGTISSPQYHDEDDFPLWNGNHP